jgi:DNA polymerase-1
MVAKTIELPNIKKAFIPDPGMIIGDFDLKGADAQVVAWEAEDESLMEFFRTGTESIHDFNARAMGRPRPQAKAGCHLTNYGGKAATLAATTGMSFQDSEKFQQQWFALHPGIERWHRRVEHDLLTKREVQNIFGYRRYYFDKIDSRLLPQALAWIPQSTVGLIISKALCIIDAKYPWIQPLLQVHDSLVLQWPKHRTEEAVDRILTSMAIPLPYPEPLIIPVSYKLSDKSWGDC